MSGRVEARTAATTWPRTPASSRGLAMRQTRLSKNSTGQSHASAWTSCGRAMVTAPALTDPVSAGAVTIALPQDVQAEAWDWPVEFFDKRVWRIARPLPEAGVLGQVVAAVRASTRPLIVAGGGVAYSEATQVLARFAEATGIPVAETQAGKGSLAWDHPQSVGAIGATGTTAANTLAAESDLVVGIGTRWRDFTTASMTASPHPGF